MKKLAAEFVGTFALVFAGTGAIIVNDVSGGAVTHVGVALTFGLIIMTMVFALGDVSGAHFNPAVTLGFWVARRLEGNKVTPYVLSQCAGAIAASGILRVVFPQHATLGATHPAGGVLPSFVLEVAMTWLLMFVILHVTTGAKEKSITAGIAIGGVITLDALFGGTISGASMNPARSIGPAVLTMDGNDLWIYLLAPTVGSLLAVVACRCVRANDCCGIAAEEV